MPQYLPPRLQPSVLLPQLLKPPVTNIWPATWGDTITFVIIRPASDRSLLISFGDRISLETHQAVSRLTVALNGVRGVLNLHPAFASVLVDFDPRLLTHTRLEELVRERASAATGAEPAAARLIEIPVTFGGDAGPDLEDVARHTGFHPARVIQIFTAAEYLVYFVGFATCFPYLGGLPPELETPRLSTPRGSVPAGSVAIGGAQAGVYPLSSPGGWRLIGRTALRLFDPEAAPPPVLRMGSRVRFVAL
jgi:KipI family sensor histidine kinase inhibitor